MKKTLGKIILALVLVAAYFFLWRPVRVMTAQHLAKPLFQTILSSTGSTNIQLGKEDRGVSFPITWNEGDDVHSILYSPQTGFFFLVALVSLVFITFEPAWYLYMVGFHLVCFLLVLLFVIFGLYSFYFGFRIADLLISYLVPVFSMGYIPWLIYFRNSEL